jgi:predicted outer membrane repeat protein
LVLVGDTSSDSLVLDTASFSCSGGNGVVFAAANESLARLLQSSARSSSQSSGVQWTDCGSHLASCLLTICGDSRVKIQGAKISGLVHQKELSDGEVVGGLVCIAGRSVVHFGNLNLTNNSGHARGLWAMEDSNVTITNDSIIAGNRGGGLGADSKSHLVVSGGSQLLSNKVSMDSGAALVAYGNSSVVLAEDVEVSNNIAMGYAGGALAAFNYAVVTLSGPVLIKNNTSVGANGGAITLVGGAKLMVADLSSLSDQSRAVAATDVIFEGNVAKNGSGGAVCAAEFSTVHITGFMRFVNNTGMHGGAILAMNSSQVWISHHTTFQDNAAYEGSGGVLRAQDDASVIIKGPGVVMFGSTSTEPGGATMVQGNARLSISSGVVLYSNRAIRTSGGALAALGNSSVVLCCDVVMQNNTGSDYQGGAVLVGMNASLDVSKGVQFLDNTVTYSVGGALAAVGNAAVTIFSNVTFRNNSSPQFLGGGISAEGQAVVLVKEDVLFENNSAAYDGGAVMASMDANVTMLGRVTFWNNSANTGGAIAARDTVILSLLDGVHFDHNMARIVGSDVWVDVDCTFTMEGANIPPNSSSVLWLRKYCDLGEFIGPDGFCQRCPTSTFGLDPNHITCGKCPINANCPGGAVIEPLAGYWHSSKYSPLVHSCPRKDLCLYNGECKKGYEGNVCGKCAIGYGFGGPFTCRMCIPFRTTLAIYASAAVVMFVVVSTLLHTTLKDNQTGVSGDRPSDFLKIMVRHVQYLVILSSIGLRWPSGLAFIFTAASYVFATAGGAGFISLDCLLPAQGLPFALKRSAAYLLAPAVIFLSALGTRLLLRAVHKLFLELRLTRCCTLAEEQQQPRVPNSAGESYGTSVLVIAFVASLVTLFSFYPSLVALSLSFFTCVPLDSKMEQQELLSAGSEAHKRYAVANATYGYWVHDMQQPCWEGWHRAWALGLGIPCAFVFCIAVPVALGWVLVANKKLMQSPGMFRKCMGFLYHSYRGDKFYWEVINTLQLAVLVAIKVFVHVLRSYYSTLMFQLCFLAMLASHYVVQPYVSARLNRTLSLSMGCMFITTSIALTLFSVDQEAPHGYADAAAAVGLVINVVFIGWCCILALKHSTGVLGAMAQKFSSSLVCFRNACTCQGCQSKAQDIATQERDQPAV